MIFFDILQQDRGKSSISLYFQWLPFVMVFKKNYCIACLLFTFDCIVNIEKLIRSTNFFNYGFKLCFSGRPMSNKFTEEKIHMSDPKLTIIATKGTLDWAYPPALGMSVSIFYTFYGLNLLLKDTSSLKVTPTGNPSMPMKMPMGPKWFRAIGNHPDEKNHLKLRCCNHCRAARALPGG